jgi:hypothetical protein
LFIGSKEPYAVIVGSQPGEGGGGGGSWGGGGGSFTNEELQMLALGMGTIMYTVYQDILFLCCKEQHNYNVSIYKCTSTQTTKIFITVCACILIPICNISGLQSTRVIAQQLHCGHFPVNYLMKSNVRPNLRHTINNDY